MKMFLMSSDAEGRHCGIVKSQLLDYLPLTDKESECDAVVVSVSYLADYKFNQKLYDISKPVVLIDYCEFGWDWNQEQNNLLGSGRDSIVNFPMYNTGEWGELDEWAYNIKPELYFKRELLEKDRTKRILPCEYLCYLPETKPQTEKEFNERPIEVFYNWGWSHPSRIDLHADIFRAMNTHNIGVVSNWTHLPQYFEHKSLRTWLSIYSPWYDRQPMSKVLEWQSRSKLSVCLPGAGVKTFRHGEAIDTIPCLVNENLAWSYPWVDRVNCLLLDPEYIFEYLLNAKDIPGLYQIYLAACENMNNYRPKNYVDNWILPNIERNL